MQHDSPAVLFSRDRIAARVAEVGAQLSHDYAGQRLVLIGVLKGAAFFLSDLARAISLDCTFDFIAVSSYGNSTKNSGAVKLLKDFDHPIEGEIVVLVEDILDTGVTLSYLCKVLRQRRPRSLVVAACVDKPSQRIERIDADYVCFTIDNHFVVGYGMDFAEKYRNLPDICLMPMDRID